MSGIFVVGTSTVTKSQSVTITGTVGTTQQTAQASVNPLGLGTISVSPTTVNGGASASGTVTLNGAAPKGGFVLKLASSSKSVTVPASLTIPAGSTSGTFSVKTAAVSSSTVSLLTATLNGITATASLTVNSPILQSIVLNPTSVVGGVASTGTVTISSIAGAGGYVVKLASGLTGVTLPASVTIPAGKTSANFAVKSSPVKTVSTASITATAGGATLKATLTVNPVSILSITLAPASVKGGASSTATLKLTGVVPTGGLVVTLSSNLSSATVPATVTIAAGRTSGVFTVKTVKVTSKSTATISAAANSTTKTAQLTIS